MSKALVANLYYIVSLVERFLFFGKNNRDKGLSNAFKWMEEKLVFLPQSEMGHSPLLSSLVIPETRMRISKKVWVFLDQVSLKV